MQHGNGGSCNSEPFFRTFEKGQSLFFLVMLASELLGLDDSEAVLPIPSALVKLDDKDGDKAEPIVTPSLTLHT